MDDEKILKAFQEVDFKWLIKTDNIWKDTGYSVPLHEPVKQEILDSLKGDQESMLGWVITGKGGSGKTHLLKELRKEAAHINAGFIIVDMAGVNCFWDTILQEFLSSLDKPFKNDIPQYQSLFGHLFKNSKEVNEQLKKLTKPDHLVKQTRNILNALSKRNQQETLKYQDVIRALVMKSSENFDISDIGYSWLLGLGIDEKDKKRYKFKTNKKSPQDIIKGISWVMSLKRPVILALDQLDAIVKAYDLASLSGGKDTVLSNQQKHSLSIIEEIAGGMSDLVNTVTKRTIVIVSCLESTWEILCKTVETNQDRFYPPRTLKPINRSELSQQMIELRLKKAYQKYDIEPKYLTWPFAREAFEKLDGIFPRELLKRCDAHLKKCIKEKNIIELTSFAPTDNGDVKEITCESFKSLNEQYEALKKQAHPQVFLDDKKEDTLMDDLLETACLCIVKENPPPENVDAAVDLNFQGEKSFSFLHVRVRLIYTDEQEREEHFCLRALFKTHAAAYNNRLKAAITASGIDQNIDFRKLVIVRNKDMKKSKKTIPLTKQFEEAGGIFVEIKHDEIRSLWALHEMMKENDSEFDIWLNSCKPVSKLPFMQNGFPQLCQQIPSEKKKKPVVDKKEKKKKEPPENFDHLYLGKKLIGEKEAEDIFISKKMLTKHSVILAGSGSGKTVLIRRIIEEASLLGIPSIVIDCANDLARLGDSWPTSPENFQHDDIQKSKKYFKNTDVMIWTPGLKKGNPLCLETLPDFNALNDDEDELSQALTMVISGFQPLIAKGTSAKAKKKLGVFAAALEYFARHGGGNLASLVELLSDLPPEADANITNAQNLAIDIADILNAQIQIDPMLSQQGVPLDPAILFGLNDQKTRISIISFIGLPGLEPQQQFLNQLAMTLFTWIKKNPAPENNPIRGLLIIDEAKDYIPSGHKTTACKESLIQLAGQARKYGLGLIFATQAPKSIDHNIIANCTTQFYGQANSPAAINVVKDLLKQKKCSGEDIPTLGTGKFYVYSEHIKPPQKIATSLCLSYHPETTLTDTDIKKKAVDSKKCMKKKT
ncbi:ATPase AAA [Candidatus Magnetomorum sp. HK-1]|nr:ATPase AAA [Candidatus Magnetomorum sp. HK-1]